MSRWIVVLGLLALFCAGVVTLGGYAGFEFWRVGRAVPDAQVAAAPASTPEAPAAPSAPPAACAEGKAAFEAKDFEAATTKLEVCVELAPDDNAARMLLGRAWAQVGRFERADVQLTHALGDNPGDERGWEALVYARVHSDNDRGALLALDDWLDQKPDSSVALRMRADVHYRLGDRAPALADAERSCTLGDADGCTLKSRLADVRRHR